MGGGGEHAPARAPSRNRDMGHPALENLGDLRDLRRTGSKDEVREICDGDIRHRSTHETKGRLPMKGLNHHGPRFISRRESPSVEASQPFARLELFRNEV